MENISGEYQYIDREHACDYLQALVGKPLGYALKSRDMSFYDLGFGDDVAAYNRIRGHYEICEITLHVASGMKIFWKDGTKEELLGDAPATITAPLTQKLAGHPIRRIALSEKNDLWLDFGICHMVVVTYEDGEESWRVFGAEEDAKHLVAADSWIRL